MELTDNQKRAIIIFTILLGLLIAVMALLTNYWVCDELPKAPVLTGPDRSPEVVKKEIENYKALTDALQDSKGFLNDLLVVKFIKPVFDALVVAIIAYLFGNRLILALVNRINKK